MWPNLARVQVRHSLGNIFSGLQGLYGAVAITTVSQSPETDKEVSAKLDKLEKALVATTELVPIARGEPRLESPFPAESYLKLLQGAQFILFRLQVCYLLLRRGV